MTTSQTAGIISGVLKNPNQKPCNCSLYPRGNHKAPHEITYFRIPKFIQAIVTLFICGVILSATLCIIVRVRRRLSKRNQNNRSESEQRNDIEGGPTATNNPSHVKFVRRPSGPFGDERIALVKESYMKPPKLSNDDPNPVPHST